MNSLFPEHEENRFQQKIENAIERMRMADAMSRKYLDSPLYICISGGKDSSVIQQLAIESGLEVIFSHSHTTVDAPETVRFIRSEMERLKAMGYQTMIVYPKYSMWQLIEKNRGMPPLRTRRYCCDYLKEQSLRRHLNKKIFIVTGVRWSESPKRKLRMDFEVLASDPKNAVRCIHNDNELDRKMFEDCRLKGERVCNPILDWSDEDVWKYIRSRNLPYNPLYDEGWKRIGCIGCPMANTKQRQAMFERWPKYKKLYIAAFERGLKKGISEGKTYTFANGTEKFNWWMMRDD